ncbi:TKL family protein kinase [Tritrichomonas foetus]|uniref:TKL family protein kinase n=1 Tax=Tritrichomonas foetus TaxID=1144522 RepID=A0A1J4J4Z7_9EUKA|nr:TKL family protein kinase [Tritrichomonas foetus]|eukprot:OHS93223.1 TKL family protein kinase [Tritrichomonas foetus]
MQNQKEILERNFKILEGLSYQTAVHRKKFEFALSNLRQVIISIMSQYDSLGRCGPKLIKKIIPQMQEFQNLLGQNILLTWTSTTLENPSDYVLEQLIQIFKTIKDKIIEHAPGFDIEKSLEISMDQWNQYNILDLYAIEGSFSQCLARNNEKSLLNSMLERKLISIRKKLAQESKPIISPPTSPIPSAYHNWKVNLSDFTVFKEIGHGVTARVYLAKDKRPGIDPLDGDVAIKQFEMTRLNGSRFQAFQREVAVLATCQHPALLKLVGMTDSIPFCIITQWMPNGSLFHDLHKYHRMDQTLRTIAAYDIARCMQYLHSRQIAHRDLKSLNVLIDRDLHAKVCDFGFSRHADDSTPMSSNIGTPHWMAPEILKPNVTYTSKVDVYAYGIVLWEIATGLTPYYGMDSRKIINLVSNQGMRPEMPKNISKELSDLIRKCWDTNPDIRPSFDEVVRQFKSLNIFYPGTDMVRLSQYIEESATSSEVITEQIEIIINSVKEGKNNIQEAVEILKKSKIPPSLVDECWSLIEQNVSKIEISDLVRILQVFSSTPKYLEYVQILRKLPKNAIPPEIITKFVEDLPTGSVDIDRNIAIAACRNGQADLCAVYVTNPQLVATSLDVLSQSEIDLQLREAVIDKCFSSIMLEDENLQCSALRCLLINDQVKRLPMNFIEKSLTSKNKALESLSILAVISALMKNIIVPKEIINIAFSKLPDERVFPIMILLSRNKDYVDNVISIIDKIASNSIPFTLKILMSATKTITKERSHFSFNEGKCSLLEKIENSLLLIDLNKAQIEYKESLDYLKCIIHQSKVV